MGLAISHKGLKGWVSFWPFQHKSPRELGESGRFKQGSFYLLREIEDDKIFCRIKVTFTLIIYHSDVI